MMGVAFIQAFRDPRLEILYRTSLDATGTQRFFSFSSRNGVFE